SWVESNGAFPAAIQDSASTVWEESGCTSVFVGCRPDVDENSNGEPVLGYVAAVLGLRDSPRESAVATVKWLRAAGVQVHIVSGDSARVARAVAREVGISELNVWAGVKPEEKAQRVKLLKERVAGKGSEKWKNRASAVKRRGNLVAFVGDGVNDAVALAAADVGIAIGAGSEIAHESASVILTRSNPEDVVVFLDLSRAVMRRIRYNLAWAFVFNIIGIPVAAGVLYPWTGIALQPWMAGQMWVGGVHGEFDAAIL
ncbi:hypothetical protein HK101_001567, partial [Irineochytrium annulatum]